MNKNASGKTGTIIDRVVQDVMIPREFSCDKCRAREIRCRRAGGTQGPGAGGWNCSTGGFRPDRRTIQSISMTFASKLQTGQLFLRAGNSSRISFARL